MLKRRKLRAFRKLRSNMATLILKIDTVLNNFILKQIIDDIHVI